MKEDFDSSSDLEESSERKFDEDFEQMKRDRAYPSETNPEDDITYRITRLIPESSRDFRGLLDKDLVLSNIKESKPDPAVLRFLLGTINLFKSSILKEVTYNVKENNQIIQKKRLIFDEELFCVLEYLIGEFKFDVVSARAMGEQRETGLIAQEVNAVLPEATFTGPDGYMGIHYDKLVGLLVEAVKELEQKIGA